MNAWFRSLFFSLPKKGDTYVFDDDYRRRRDPWDTPSPHSVEVLDAKRGWVRYAYCGGTLFKDERMSRSSFHFCYRKRQNPSGETPSEAR